MAQDLLEQILGKGQNLVKQAKNADTAELTARGKAVFKQGEDALAGKLGMGDDAESRKKLRIGAAAAAGGLALLLRNRSNRKLAALGGLGGLGYIAYKAQQAGKLPKSMDEVMALINGQAQPNRAEALLVAMVSAAKADGDISREEQEMFNSLDGLEAEDIRAVLAGDVDPKAVAAYAKNEQMALEIYGASCRVANGLNPRERDYLDHLAMELRLDPEIAARVETDVRTG
jgi:uncharacterized membrane protein YebE (DUF533 family)